MPPNLKFILKFTLFFIIGFFLICGQKAFATPMLYSFQGHVTYDRWDTLGLLNELGITNGYDISYVFLVDLERQGIEWENDGDIYHTYEDSPLVDHFFALLLTDAYLIPDWYAPDYGTLNGSNKTNSERAYLYNMSREGGRDDITTFKMDHYIDISGDDFIQDWQVGKILSGSEWVNGPGENIYCNIQNRVLRAR